MIGLDHKLRNGGFIWFVYQGWGGKKAVCCVRQNYAAIDILLSSFYEL